MSDRSLHTLGQITGYAAGLGAWLNIAKDFVGFIGVAAGAALSLWALYDKWKKRQARKAVIAARKNKKALQATSLKP